MGNVLSDFSTEKMNAANEKNIFLFWDYYFGCTPVKYEDGSRTSQYISNIPFPLFNGILSTQFISDIDSKIGDLKESFNSRQLPFFWWITPSDRPKDIGRVLESNGFVCAEEHPGMSVDLNELEQEHVPDLKIQRVEDETLLKQWVHTMFMGSGFPPDIENAYYKIESEKGFSQNIPVQRYLGFYDKKPVTTSLVFLAAGVAGIYGVATLPEDRKQGFGSAITLAALLDARSIGYRIGILQSSEMGFNVYRRMGFKEYFTLQVYVQPDTESVF